METIAGLFLSGIAFGFGACVASCGPLLISYAAGTGKSAAGGLRMYAVFSAARIIAYCLLALIVYCIGQFALEKFVRDYTRPINIAAGSFIVVLGMLTCAGKASKFSTFNICRHVMIENDTKSIAFMGFSIGLLPCAPLVAILSYVGLVAKSAAAGICYAAVFGVGTALSPLAGLVFAAGFIARLRGKVSAVYERIFHLVCGAVIIYLGIGLIRAGMK